MVVPVDAIADRDEHLAVGSFLPMPGVDRLGLHPAEEPLRGGVVRRTALRARRPRRAVPFHEVRPSGPPAVASRGLDEHPAGEPRVGTGTGGVRDDPAVMAVDRRREARPSRPWP